MAMFGRVVNKVLPEVMLTRKSLTAWPASSAGPNLKVLAQLATVWAVFVEVVRVWLPTLLKLGASLTELTVMVKFCNVEVSTPLLAVPPLS
ncbi:MULTISPECIES: hypothetical protein [unclassified Microcoleus]|uniref:hypothetical protein n=1 Tax=unclassified Microcoleus TaxID=2642155 RepID=UPI002FD456A6